MANFTVQFRDEVQRIARKTIRAEVDQLKKASARYRGEIAELKRLLADMKRRVVASEKLIATNAQGGDSEKRVFFDGPQVRFSPAGLKKLRLKHGLSAAMMGNLFGVTQKTIFNWESGVRPNTEHLQKIALLRKVSARQMREWLDAQN